MPMELGTSATHSIIGYRVQGLGTLYPHKRSENLANSASAKQSLPIGVVIGVIVVLLALLGFFGWKIMNGGAPQEGEKVKIDLEQVKKDMKNGGGFGDER